jgi:hypothetical protein
VLPHLIDTVLLGSALTLAYLSGLYPLQQHWLTAKVLALIIYIVAGAMALRRAKIVAGRLLASVTAIVCYLYVYTHSGGSAFSFCDLDLNAGRSASLIFLERRKYANPLTGQPGADGVHGRPCAAAQTPPPALAEQQQALRNGSLSAQQLLQSVHSNRAKESAAISLDPQAKQAALLADQQKNFRLPLAGLPLLIKDNIDAQGTTTAGSLALAENLKQQDAPVVARLRKAGAIIAGNQSQ